MNLKKVNIWTEIEREYDISKRTFAKKIYFVKDNFKRRIIFRDVEHAYLLAENGFSKPAVLLVGSVIEEVLRLYLIHKKIKPADDKFNSYIEICKQEGYIKTAIQQLTNFIRYYRNLIHMKEEASSRISISKATAKGAVASIFTIINDL